MNEKLEKYILGQSVHADKIYLGKLNSKKTEWLIKKDITDMFLSVVESWLPKNSLRLIENEKGGDETILMSISQNEESISKAISMLTKKLLELK